MPVVAAATDGVGTSAVTTMAALLAAAAAVERSGEVEEMRVDEV